MSAAFIKRKNDGEKFNENPMDVIYSSVNIRRIPTVLKNSLLLLLL